MYVCVCVCMICSIVVGMYAVYWTSFVSEDVIGPDPGEPEDQITSLYPKCGPVYFAYIPTNML